MKVIYTKKFISEYKKLPRDIRFLLIKKEEIFKKNPFDPRLKTHKLTGDLDGVWACSAGYDWRVLFEFIQHEGSEAILLLTVGTHDEVY